MVQGSFVLRSFQQKTIVQKRQVNFRQTNYRYLAVVLAIFVVFGCEYCFDNASALQTQINYNHRKQTGSDYGESQFNLLYSLYAFPNVIIPLLGGMMIDKYGARFVMILTCCFCVLGQFVFGVGGFENSFTIMIVGRIIFGIGGEVLHASQNTLISNWFKPNELSMVLGICLSFPKMGSSLNSYVSPLFGKKFRQEQSHTNLNVAFPIFIGFFIMCISLVLAVVLSYLDKKSQNNQKVMHQSALLSSSGTGFKQNKKKMPKKDAIDVRTISQAADDIEHESKTNQDGGGDHLNFKQIGNLPLAFWLIVLISMLTEALFIPFFDNGNEYYKHIFGLQSDEAGIYLILPYIVSSLFVIILGFISDRVKKRGLLLIASCGFIAFTYLFMMIVESTRALRQSAIIRWFPSVLLGICTAIFCCIVVPTIPMLVSPKLLGTGFGIMEMIQNLALGCFPLIAGALRETKLPQGGGEQEGKLQAYHFQTLFFFIVSCLCLGLSIILFGYDTVNGKRLQVQDFRKKYLTQILKEDTDQ